MHKAGTRPRNIIDTFFVAAIAGLALKPIPRRTTKSWLVAIRASFSRLMALPGRWRGSLGDLVARIG